MADECDLVYNNNMHSDHVINTIDFFECTCLCVHCLYLSFYRMFMSPKRITSGAITYRFRLPVRVLAYELQGISTSKTGLSTSPDPCDWVLEGTNHLENDQWQLIDVQQNHSPESWAAASTNDYCKRFDIRTGEPLSCMQYVYDFPNLILLLHLIMYFSCLWH